MVNKNRSTIWIVDDSVTESSVQSFCVEAKQSGSLSKVLFFGDDSSNAVLIKRIAAEGNVSLEFFDNVSLQLSEHFVVFRESLKLKFSEIAFSKCNGALFRDRFKITSDRSCVWDMSLFSELNPIKTPVYHWASLLDFLASEILRSGRFADAYICVSNKLLSNAIVACLEEHSVSICKLVKSESRSGFRNKMNSLMGDGTVLREGLSGIVSIFKYLKRKLTLQFNRVPCFITSEKTLLVTYFPGFYETEDGKFRSNYVENLQSLIENNSGDYSFLLKVEPNPSCSYGDSIKELKKLSLLEGKFGVLENFLTFSVLFRLPVDLWRLQFAALKLRKTFSASLAMHFENRGQILLFEFLWMRSFLSHVGTEALAYSRIFEKAKKVIPQNTQIVVPAEMHAWERALYAELGGWAKTIAYPHGNPTSNYLAYFPVENNLDAVESLPDVFASPGMHFEHWKSVSSVRYKEVEAHRQMYLTNVSSGEVKSRSHSSDLLIVGPGRPEEAANVLKLLDARFSHGNNLRVFYKAHPVCPLAEIEKFSGFTASDLGVQEINGTMSELLSSFSVVLVPGTTVGIEAIVYGCEVIVPEWASRVQLSPLVGYESCYWKVWNSSSLDEVLGNVFVEGHSKNSKEMSCRIRESFFCLEEGLPRWKELLDL